MSVQARYSEDFFRTAMSELDRFEIADSEDLEKVLAEGQLSQTDLVSKEHAAWVGKFAAADLTLIPELVERANELSLLVRLVDNEVTKVVFSDSTFCSKDAVDIRIAMNGLASNVSRALTLSSVDIIEIFEDGSIRLDAKGYGYPGMRFVVYKEEEVISKKTGKILGMRTRILAGDAKIREVLEDGTAVADIARDLIADDASIEEGVKAYFR